MEDLIVILVIAAILSLVIWYIRREKKRGVKCIGCPAAGSCASKGGCPGCSCQGK